MLDSLISKLAGKNPIANGVMHGMIVSTMLIILTFALLVDKAQAELFSTEQFRTVDHPIVTWYAPARPVVLNCLFIVGGDGNGLIGSYRLTLSSRLKELAIVSDSCQYFKGVLYRDTGELIIFNVNNAGSALLTQNETKHFILTKYNIW